VQGCAAEAVIAWDEEHLPLPREDTQTPSAPHSRFAKRSAPEASPGIWETLRAAGVQVFDSALPQDGAQRTARLADLDRAAVGVTGALGGLADTGSLALASGPGRGRLASLLPTVLVTLLPVTSLYPSMAAFFADHPDVPRQASNLVFITGPSRTADIEQTLTLGVHGPHEIHVILLDV
jgi:L-lactate dehydrogenase complex protein LldG